MTLSLRRHLTVRQLLLVSTLARELNLSRCAELLHTTQPAASRTLAQLERQLGITLFERTTKHIRPTSAGQSLAQHADRILSEIDVAEEDLLGLRETAGGELRIGALAVFSPEALSQAVAAPRRMLPELMPIVHLQSLETLHQSLLEGRIDLMLSHAEFRIDLNRVEVRALYEESSVVLAAPGHRLAKRRKRVSWEELAQEAWVLPPRDTPLRPKIDRLLSVHRERRPQAGPDVQTESAALALNLLRDADMLWAIASRHALQFEREGRARRIATPDVLLRGPICCFSRRGEMLRPAQRMFIAALERAAAQAA